MCEQIALYTYSLRNMEVNTKRNGTKCFKCWNRRGKGISFVVNVYNSFRATWIFEPFACITRIKINIKNTRDFPGGPVAKTQHSQWGVPGSIPGQGTRPHMPQLRILHAQLRSDTAKWINNFLKYYKQGEGNGNSSILAWRIPWTEQPGRLWSIGSQRVRENKPLSTHAC